jgi:hypothetical protein
MKKRTSKSMIAAISILISITMISNIRYPIHSSDFGRHEYNTFRKTTVTRPVTGGIGSATIRRPGAIGGGYSHARVGGGGHWRRPDRRRPDRRRQKVDRQDVVRRYKVAGFFSRIAKDHMSAPGPGIEAMPLGHFIAA